MADHVTAVELAEVLGAGADSTRVEIAVGAANALIDTWVGLPVDADEDAEVPVTAVTRQAGLEAGQVLYRRHAAAGGFLDQGGLLAQLPPDVSRGLRDLLDADSHTWGLA